MRMDAIDKQMKDYIANREIAGASLLVRNENGIVYQNKWGYANIEAKKPVEYDTIFRQASLTKPIIAVAILILVEQGKLELDDEINVYIPEFDHLMVCKTTETNLAAMNDPAGVDLANLQLEPAKRNVTIRDLLTHSSGLGMGEVGNKLARMLSDPSDSLETRFHKFGSYPADFEPGDVSGYSGIVGFDLLGRIIEVASGFTLDRFLQQFLFDPLEMNDTTFHLAEHHRERLAVLYSSEGGELFVVPDSEGIEEMILYGPRYCSGGAGLYSTLVDYDRFGQMLLHEGQYYGRTILRSETVKRIHQESAYKQQLEFAPGLRWGLGMSVRQQPEQANSPLTTGSYGWSGAYGTHFFIDPASKLETVLMLNVSNIGGAGSHVSKRIEELIAAAYL